MKILTFLTCAILIAPTAHAATKCVPDPAQMTCIPYNGQLFENSSYWEATCTTSYTNTSVYLEGNAHCFTEYGNLYGAENYLSYSPNEQLLYCWCNLREPALSEYLYVKKFNSQSDCLKNCAKSCLESLSNNSFLTALSNAIISD